MRFFGAYLRILVGYQWIVDLGHIAVSGASTLPSPLHGQIGLQRDQPYVGFQLPQPPPCPYKGPGRSGDRDKMRDPRALRYLGAVP